MGLLLSEWMGNKVVEWKEVSSRLMWVRVRMGRECWAFVSAYGPVQVLYLLSSHSMPSSLLLL